MGSSEKDRENNRDRNQFIREIDRRLKRQFKGTRYKLDWETGCIYSQEVLHELGLYIAAGQMDYVIRLCLFSSGVHHKTRRLMKKKLPEAGNWGRFLPQRPKKSKRL